jgi:transposase
MLLPLAGGRGTVVKFGEFIMILELHRQSLTIAAIARQLGIDRKSAKEEVLANVAERTDARPFPL